MENRPATPEGSQLPWAAYTLGHFAQTLPLEQEVRWTLRGWSGTVVGEDPYSARFLETLRTTRQALRALALGDQVRAGVLVELHRALDQFASVYEGMVESLRSAPETPSPPGLEAWRDVESLACGLLPPSSDLRLWFRLGAILGKCRLLLRLEPELERGGLAGELQDLPGWSRNCPGTATTLGSKRSASLRTRWVVRRRKPPARG
jgi:hypothetical protein